MRFIFLCTLVFASVINLTLASDYKNASGPVFVKPKGHKIVFFQKDDERHFESLIQMEDGQTKHISSMYWTPEGVKKELGLGSTPTIAQITIKDDILFPANMGLDFFEAWDGILSNNDDAATGILRLEFGYLSEMATWLVPHGQITCHLATVKVKESLLPECKKAIKANEKAILDKMRISAKNAGNDNFSSDQLFTYNTTKDIIDYKMRHMFAPFEGHLEEIPGFQNSIGNIMFYAGNQERHLSKNDELDNINRFFKTVFEATDLTITEQEATKSKMPDSNGFKTVSYKIVAEKKAQ